MSPVLSDRPAQITSSSFVESDHGVQVCCLVSMLSASSSSYAATLSDLSPEFLEVHKVGFSLASGILGGVSNAIDHEMVSVFFFSII